MTAVLLCVILNNLALHDTVHIMKFASTLLFSPVAFASVSLVLMWPKQYPHSNHDQRSEQYYESTVLSFMMLYFD